MLVRQLVPFKLDNRNRWDFHHAPSRRNARQHPIDHRGMRKVDDEFVDDRVCTNGSANRRKTKVGWIDGYEMVGIKTLQLSLTHPSRHRRDVVDVGLRN